MGRATVCSSTVAECESSMQQMALFPTGRPIGGSRAHGRTHRAKPDATSRGTTSTHDDDGMQNPLRSWAGSVSLAAADMGILLPLF